MHDRNPYAIAVFQFAFLSNIHDFHRNLGTLRLDGFRQQNFRVFAQMTAAGTVKYQSNQSLVLAG